MEIAGLVWQWMEGRRQTQERARGKVIKFGLGLAISKKEESRMNVKFLVYIVLRAITIVLDAGTVI